MQMSFPDCDDGGSVGSNGNALIAVLRSFSG